MSFIAAIETLVPLSIHCKTAISKKAQRQDLPKGGKLVVNHHLYYLESGLVRVFYDAPEKEVSGHFEREGGFIASVRGFSGQESPREYMEALERCQFQIIKSADLQVLLLGFPELNLHFRLLYQKYLRVYDARLHLLCEPDPVKQYEEFLQLYPNLAHRLQVQHIAQFLNVHPSTLSKVRKKLK